MHLSTSNDNRGICYAVRMTTEEEHAELMRELRSLNAEIRDQRSLSRMFVMGVIYGIGFFVGSAIIATLLLGLLGPVFGAIPWIRDAFMTGLSLVH